MTTNRRRFLVAAGAAGMGALSCSPLRGEPQGGSATELSGGRAGNPIAVSTYSYWRYRADSKLTIDRCIDLAAETGFDAVEILVPHSVHESIMIDAAKAGKHIALQKPMSRGKSTRFPVSCRPEQPWLESPDQR